MKYLSKFNESSKSIESIIDDLNDILLELNDKGFNCRVTDNLELPRGYTPQTNNNIPRGYKLELFEFRTHDIITILFDKERPGFYFNDIKETYYRIKSYLTDNGYSEEDDFEANFLKQYFPDKKINGVGGLLYTSVSFKKEL
jgi:hypothetical protein